MSASSHGPRHSDQHSLHKCGDEEDDQADLDRPDPLRAGLQRGIHGVGGVMAVQTEHTREPTPQPTTVLMLVLVLVRVIMQVVARVSRLAVFVRHVSPHVASGG
ncbi:MAG TPA: hypothetical protein VFD59_02580 [Nocardioidaceae bacterium]|nr:hypothetical protein [Nocardioidaceae bacterium]